MVMVIFCDTQIRCKVIKKNGNRFCFSAVFFVYSFYFASFRHYRGRPCAYTGGLQNLFFYFPVCRHFPPITLYIRMLQRDGKVTA